MQILHGTWVCLWKPNHDSNIYNHMDEGIFDEGIGNRAWVVRLYFWLSYGYDYTCRIKSEYN
jgi:hypothetical protein